MSGQRTLRKTPELAWGPGTVALRLPAEHGLVAGAAEPQKRETWIQISKVGGWKGHGSGPFALTREHFESAIAEQAKLATPLNFDYEHASASCIPVHAPSSGYASKLEIRGEPGSETLWAYTRLTKKAVQEVLDEEYRHISPTWMFDHPDRVEGEEKQVVASLHSVALTNTPFLDGMEPITLSATMSRLATIGRFANIALAGKAQMEDEKPSAPPEETPAEEMDDAKIVERMMAVLGLADRGALSAWMDEKEKAPAAASSSATEAALRVSMRQNDADRAELERLRSEEANRAVTALIASGHALEEERADLIALRAAAPELFSKLASRKPVVPMGRESRAGSVGQAKDGPLVLSELEQRVAMSLRAGGLNEAEVNAAIRRDRERKENVR